MANLGSSSPRVLPRGFERAAAELLELGLLKSHVGATPYSGAGAWALIPGKRRGESTLAGAAPAAGEREPC